MKKILQILLVTLLVLTSVASSFAQPIEVKNGEATVKLRGGETITMDNLPAGLKYQITEEQLDDWVLSSKEGDVGKIEPNKKSVATFVNRYSPKSVSITLTGKKLLDGKPEGEFIFELVENGQVIDKASSVGGVFSFKPIVYKIGGPHKYTIREVAGSNSSINYDKHEENVDVRVLWQADGKLKADIIYDQDGVVFKNTKKKGSLEVEKKVVGYDTGEKFQFELWDGSIKISDFSLGNNETKTFDNLDPEKEYTIKEINVPDDYISINTNDPTPNIPDYTGLDPLMDLIIPTNLGDFDLSKLNSNFINFYKTKTASETFKVQPEQTYKSQFLNVYKNEGEINLVGKKELIGDNLKGGEFYFEVLDENNKILARAQNDANGSIIFDPIKLVNISGFNDKQSAKLKVVEKVKTIDPTIEYDKQEKIITLNKRFENGKLNVDIDYGETPLTFTNKKKGYPFSFSKEVTGTKREDNFEFILKVFDKNQKEVNSTFKAEHLGQELEIQTNKPFSVDTKDIYTIKDIPEGYIVEISEKDKENYTLDKEKSVLRGQISANEKLNLKVVNKYFAKNSIKLIAKKILHNANLKNYSFEYYLLDENDGIIDNASNDKEGKIEFSPLTYTSEDVGKEFKIKVVEVNNKVKNIVYDKTVYNVKLKVKDSENGIKIEQEIETNPITNPDGQMIFNNYYMDIPLTGRNGITIGLAIGSLLVLVSLYYLKRRK